MAETTPKEMLDTFVERFNAGDLEGVVALYEPNAVFVEAPGQAGQGRTAILESVKKFLATKLRLELPKRETVVAGDIAANYVQWSLSGTGPDGEPGEMGGVASSVLRRQPSGEWKIVIDNPLGTGILD